MLFDPVGEYVGAGFELKDIMLRKTEASELEFFMPAGSLIEIDGAPRRAGCFTGRFATVRLEARGVRVELGPGAIGDDGFSPKLTPLQQQVRRLLGVPASAYQIQK